METGKKSDPGESLAPGGAEALWKNHPLVVIFVVWLVVMLPLGFFIWDSGPSQVREVASARDSGGVLAGAPREFPLDAGPHGIWATVAEDGPGAWPEGTFSVIVPGGERAEVLPPNGSSIRLGNDGKTTLLVGVFRATTAGPYVLVVETGAEGSPVANFGPAWADGDGVGVSSGFVSLSLMWVVTAFCAVVALRVSQRKRADKLGLPKEADTASSLSPKGRLTKTGRSTKTEGELDI